MPSFNFLRSRSQSKDLSISSVFGRFPQHAVGKQDRKEKVVKSGCAIAC